MDTGIDETEAIIDFVRKASDETGMRFNINLGSFIPKPHTPYQWAGQLSEEEAIKKLMFIRDRLKEKGHRVGIQDPLISMIEGIISRGDERVGEIIEKAWKEGCRLDAWIEYMKRDIWKELIQINKTLINEIMSPKTISYPLPWEFIHSSTTEAYLKKELKLSNIGEKTLPCTIKCTRGCGSCDNNVKIVQNIIQTEVISNKEMPVFTPIKRGADPALRRIIFSFSKEGPAVLHSHLTIVEIFSMAFVRSNLPISFSKGFNPLPKLEVVSPLPLGISALNEIAIIELVSFFDAFIFKETMNKNLVPGVKINNAACVFIPSGKKKHSLSSWLWGAVYKNDLNNEDHVPFVDEKKYRERRQENPWGLTRSSVLSKDPENIESGKCYFDVFRYLYPDIDPEMANI